MTKNLYIKLLAAACCLVICWACKKNVLTVSPYDYTEGKALFKINYSCPYALNPGVQIKINGVRVSNNITYATPFPGGGLNTGGGNAADYLAINAGVDTVSLSIPKAGTDIDSILLYKTTVTVDANAYQTLHVSDTAANIQSVMMTDASAKADSGIAKYRFVNLIPNGAVDLYFGTVKMASNVAFKAATDTFSVAAGSTGAWSLRLAGGTSTIGATYTSTSTTVNQRVFTIYARGYVGVTVTTDVRLPKVSFLYNK